MAWLVLLCSRTGYSCTLLALPWWIAIVWFALFHTEFVHLENEDSARTLGGLISGKKNELMWTHHSRPRTRRKEYNGRQNRCTGYTTPFGGSAPTSTLLIRPFKPKKVVTGTPKIRCWLDGVILFVASNSCCLSVVLRISLFSIRPLFSDVNGWISLIFMIEHLFGIFWHRIIVTIRLYIINWSSWLIMSSDSWLIW